MEKRVQRLVRDELMWQDSGYETKHNWNSAKQYCRSYSSSRYYD
jgi:hypothetical protein